MANVQLGATQEIHADQSGLQPGTVRLASGNVYYKDDEGKVIISNTQEELAPDIVVSSSNIFDESGNISTSTERKTATRRGTVLAEYTVRRDASGNITSESKKGDVSLLGIESSFNIMPILLGVGALGAAYLAFKG